MKINIAEQYCVYSFDSVFIDLTKLSQNVDPHNLFSDYKFKFKVTCTS